MAIKPNEQTLYTAQLKNCSINFEIFLDLTCYQFKFIVVVSKFLCHTEAMPNTANIIVWYHLYCAPPTDFPNTTCVIDYS